MGIFHFLDREKDKVESAIGAGLHFIQDKAQDVGKVADRTFDDVHNSTNTALHFLGGVADAPVIPTPDISKGDNSGVTIKNQPVSLNDLFGSVPGAVRDTIGAAGGEAVKDIGNVGEFATKYSPLAFIPGVSEQGKAGNEELHSIVDSSLEKAGVKDHGVATEIAKLAPKILEFGAGGEVGGAAEAAIGGFTKAGLGARSLGALNEIADINPAVARAVTSVVTNPTLDRGGIEAILNPRAAGSGAKLIDLGAKAVAGGAGFTVATDPAAGGKNLGDIAKDTALNTGFDVGGKLAIEGGAKAAGKIGDLIAHAKAEGVSDDVINKLESLKSVVSNEGGYIKLPGNASDDTVRKIFNQQSDANSLYHATEPDAALSILKSGKIDQFKSDIEPAVSMSRNRNAGIYQSPGLGRGVKFVVDDSKLQQTVGKTKPFVDGEITRAKDPQMYEAEQRSIKGAVPLSTVKRIELGKTVSASEESQIRQLAKEKGIPVVSNNNPSEMRNVLDPENNHLTNTIRDMNKGRNQANTAETIRATISGERESERLTNPTKLKQAKEYTVNSLPKDATPDTEVIVYRAANPDKSISSGDHVSLTESGASRYLTRNPGLQVTKETVPLRDLVGSGGTRNEFVYAPKDVAKDAVSNGGQTVATGNPGEQPKTLEEFNKALGADTRTKPANNEAPNSTLAKERKAFEDTFKPLEDTPVSKMDEIRKSHPDLGEDQFKKIEDILGSHTGPTNVKEKVNLIDMVRTPEKVLNKIGLGKEAKDLRKGYEAYQKELPEHIKKIDGWAKQVNKKGNEKIFQYLDGKEVKLNPTETKVAGEIKTYLKTWADRLGLPEDKLISSYITHVFDKDFINKEFDEDLAKIIADKLPNSVYNPYLSKRLGKLGYKEDTWAALDAYVKRSTRSVHMNPALQAISSKADGMELSQYNYVKKYIDRVNMRPTEIDNLVDNFIKSTKVGYKLGDRPTATISRATRRLIYRGTLGLNPASAIKNLSQGANTYAELGEKYMVIGTSQMIKGILAGDKELKDSGVLANNYVQDRQLTAAKKLGERTDKVLFSFFDLAERINRGTAYYGAKAKAIGQGKSEAEAKDYAKELVRKTQFSFGAVDTPPVLQSDIAKLVLQFQSYNVKQGEFLAEKFKNKEFAGLVRWAAASLLFVETVGKPLGMAPTDLIPFNNILSGENKIGETPATKVPEAAYKAITGAPDKYGNAPKDLGDRIGPLLQSLIPFVPAGTQVKKTVQGAQAVSNGGATNKSGASKFDVDSSNPADVAAALSLGQYATSGGQDYIATLNGKSSTSAPDTKAGTSGRSTSTSSRSSSKATRTLKTRKGRKVKVGKVKGAKLGKRSRKIGTRKLRSIKTT